VRIVLFVVTPSDREGLEAMIAVCEGQLTTEDLSKASPVLQQLRAALRGAMSSDPRKDSWIIARAVGFWAGAMRCEHGTMADYHCEFCTIAAKDARIAELETDLARWQQTATEEAADVNRLAAERDAALREVERLRTRDKKHRHDEVCEPCAVVSAYRRGTPNTAK